MRQIVIENEYRILNNNDFQIIKNENNKHSCKF